MAIEGKTIAIDPATPGGRGSPHALILFDGVCVLCSRGCQFVSRRDHGGYFRYLPIQSPEGRLLARELGIDPDRPDTFAFIAGGLGYVKSNAALLIAHKLPRWGWTWQARWIARSVRDSVYDFVARNRYKWFGRREVCILPAADRSWPA